MNNISEQTKAFSSSLTSYRKRPCELLRTFVNDTLGLIFCGPVVSHRPLTTTMHNIAAFFPRKRLKRRKILLNSMRSGKLASGESLSLYRLQAAQLHTVVHVNLQESDYN